ncbi:MAG: sialate O-acetylesterase [Verrucomicrobiota bacterium]
MNTPIRIEDARAWNVVICMGQSLMNGPSSQSFANVDRGNDHRLIELTNGKQNGVYTFAERMNSTGFPDDYNFGLNVSAGRQLAKLGVSNLVTLKHAVGGHSITAFIPEADRLEPIPGGQFDQSVRAVEGFEDAFKRLGQFGATINLLGFVWFQGSSDRSDANLYNNYEAHLNSLLSHYRTNVSLADANTPWLIGRSPNWQAPNVPATGLQAVRDAQEAVGAADANAVTVSIDDPLGVAITYSDGTHPEPASSERIGIVLGNAFHSNFVVS